MNLFNHTCWTILSTDKNTRSKVFQSANYWFETPYKSVAYKASQPYLSGGWGRSQPLTPTWARYEYFLIFSSFFCIFSHFSSIFLNFLPHFGRPGGRVVHPGRPWVRHWGAKWKKLPDICLFFPIFLFFLISPSFSDFWQIFRCQGCRVALFPWPQSLRHCYKLTFQI